MLCRCSRPARTREDRWPSEAPPLAHPLTRLPGFAFQGPRPAVDIDVVDQASHPGVGRSTASRSRRLIRAGGSLRALPFRSPSLERLRAVGPKPARTVLARSPWHRATRVQAQVGDDPTCRRVQIPMQRNWPSRAIFKDIRVGPLPRPPRLPIPRPISSGRTPWSLIEEEDGNPGRPESVRLPGGRFAALACLGVKRLLEVSPDPMGLVARRAHRNESGVGAPNWLK